MRYVNNITDIKLDGTRIANAETSPFGYILSWLTRLGDKEVYQALLEFHNEIKEPAKGYPKFTNLFTSLDDDFDRTAGVKLSAFLDEGEFQEAVGRVKDARLVRIFTRYGELWYERQVRPNSNRNMGVVSNMGLTKELANLIGKTKGKISEREFNRVRENLEVLLAYYSI